MSKKIEVVHPSDDFDAMVASGIVVAEFSATWCGHCRQLAPILERLADRFAGRIRFLKVDTEENGALTERMDISSIPTLFLFKNGRMTESLMGVQREGALATLLENALEEERIV